MPSPKLLRPSSDIIEIWNYICRCKEEMPRTSEELRRYVQSIKHIAYRRPVTFGDVMIKTMTAAIFHRFTKANGLGAIAADVLMADAATMFPSLLSLPFPQEIRSTAMSGALMRHVQRLGREWEDDILSRHSVSFLEELPS